MRRLFWVTVGVGGTVYVLRKVSKVNAIAAQFTPEGISAAVHNLADSLRRASADFTTSMAENEAAITEALVHRSGPAAHGRTSGPDDPGAREFAADLDDPDEYF